MRQSATGVRPHPSISSYLFVFFANLWGIPRRGNQPNTVRRQNSADVAQTTNKLNVATEAQHLALVNPQHQAAVDQSSIPTHVIMKGIKEFFRFAEGSLNVR
jgi:hypothetical protein